MKSKEFKALADKYLAKYMTKFGMVGRYCIELCFADKVSHYIDRTGKLHTPKTPEYYGKCDGDSDSYYYTITLKKFGDEAELKDTIIHELIHALLWKNRDMVDSLITLYGNDMDTRDKWFDRYGKNEHDAIDAIIKAVK